MDLIIAYVLFNIIVARFLERKRLRAGIVAHAVMFTMLLICLFALSPDDYAAYICRRIIGEGAYEKLHEAIGWWGYRSRDDSHGHNRRRDIGKARD